MKPSPHRLRHTRKQRIARLGFTLAEMMITLTLFSLVFIAMISVHLFALRVYKLSETKITATASGRKVMDRIRDPIRAASTVYVGSYNGAFTPTASGSLQIGSALKVNSMTNSIGATNYIIFFQNSASNTLCSVGTNGVMTVLAKNVTNNLCFRIEDFQGTPLPAPTGTIRSSMWIWVFSNMNSTLTTQAPPIMFTTWRPGSRHVQKIKPS